MIRYVLKRLLWLIPVLLGVSLIVLLLIDITPGDPARLTLGPTASDEQVEELREKMGLNDPLPVRYFRFITNALKGDLGSSITTGKPVIQDIAQRFPYTLLIVTISTVVALAIGLPVGVYAATHQNTWKDKSAVFACLLSVSMPNFWFALVLVQLFSVKLGWLPATGISDWRGWVLPSIALTIGYAAGIARQARSSMLEQIRQDYVVTARAKGQSERKIRYRHALKNALIPIIMIVGSVFGLSLGGAVIAEMIFSIPGLGSYTLTALTQRDYPVMQGSVLYISFAFSFIMLMVDVVFAFVDPRIRSQYSRKKRGKGKEVKTASETI